MDFPNALVPRVNYINIKYKIAQYIYWPSIVFRIDQQIPYQSVQVTYLHLRYRWRLSNLVSSVCPSWLSGKQSRCAFNRITMWYLPVDPGHWDLYPYRISKSPHHFHQTPYTWPRICPPRFLASAQKYVPETVQIPPWRVNPPSACAIAILLVAPDDGKWYCSYAT